jgi:precorrin-2 dehydrogenase/sirohydrochlorin ferrochelatase
MTVQKTIFDLYIADTPPLCDYYLGGIVTKGNVKIAISTNGKSPTTAKRLREFFEEVIPEDINKWSKI